MKKLVEDTKHAAKVAHMTAAGESKPPASRPGKQRRTKTVSVCLHPEHLATLKAREKELNLGQSKIAQLLIEKEGQEGTLARWMRRRLRVELEKTKQV